MIAAYLEQQSPKLFEGEMPLDDTSMAEYTDAHRYTYKVNPSITSSEFFSDYCEEYGSLFTRSFYKAKGRQYCALISAYSHRTDKRHL